MKTRTFLLSLKQGTLGAVRALCFLAMLSLAHWNSTAVEIWSSSPITFTKADYADWNLIGNQDEITPNVRITRANNQGIFNYAQEPGFNWSISPVGTRWAYGTTADLGSLTFHPWREFTGANPPSSVGQDAVVHLVSEDIYIDIKFTAWTAGNTGGGFSYERGTFTFALNLVGPPCVILPVGAVEPDPGAMFTSGTGDLPVPGPSTHFDTSVAGVYEVGYTGTYDGRTVTVTRRVAVVDGSEPNIWAGPTKFFHKPGGSSVGDTIVPGVKLTRRYGGHLYNSAVESGAGVGSPADTEWAFGRTSDGVRCLDFMPFEELFGGGGGGGGGGASLAALGAGPGSDGSIVGDDLVLHIISADIYLDIRFSYYEPYYYGWDEFAYERSTPFSFVLIGDEFIRLAVGDPFVDPGASATTPEGGSIPVTASPSSLDTSVPGIHLITYTATHGGASQVLTRMVQVVGEWCAAMMPSYSQNITYANAAVNEPLNVWGRIVNPDQGAYPYAYVLDFGDGDVVGGVVSTPAEANYIGAMHTYGTAGPKTATLTVIDADDNVSARSAVINVFLSPSKDNRINMAIEKALLNLYLTQNRSGLTTHWGSPLTDHNNFAAAGAALIAFEENGHLPGNNYCEDIYAETVRMGLYGILSCGSEQFIDVGPQPSGDPEISHNSRGALFVNNSYANAHGVMAVALSHPSAAEADADIIPIGAFAGESFFDIGVDMLDLFSYCQGDDHSGGVDLPGQGSNYRGGWSYTIDHSGEYRYDGSAQQWPALAYKAALDNWGVSPPAWVLANAVYGYQHLQNNELRASGYDSPYGWRNLAKTGGMLVSYALAGKAAGGDSDVDDGLAFVGDNWFSDAETWCGCDGGSWPGELYAMYGVKKGMQLLGLGSITTPTGTRDWYSDLSCWLLGDPTLDPMLGEGKRDPSQNFGQNPDGSWTQVQSPLNYPGSLITAYGVLVLTRSVTVALPVAIIEPVSAKPEDSSFPMSGDDSFHQDPAKHIVEYLWDFDASDGVDFETPDAIGEHPTNPGYEDFGTYTVTLRVVDDSTPPMFDDASINIEIRDNGFPPVAKAIPNALLPAYAGKPGESVRLDGTESYDPDIPGGIVLYEWDTDGDGAFDDSTDPVTFVTWPTERYSQVGLRVTDLAGEDNENSATVNLYFSQMNLLVKSILAPNVTPGVSAELNLVLENQSDKVADYSNLKLRFYNGHPLLGGAQIGDTVNVSIPKGTQLPYNTTFTGLGGVTTIYAYIDPDDALPEWNEVDNYKSVDVSQCKRYGDVNNDCCISTADVAAITAAIKAKSKDPKYDVNKDGKVDIADSRWVVTHFTNPGGAPCP